MVSSSGSGCGAIGSDMVSFAGGGPCWAQAVGAAVNSGRESATKATKRAGAVERRGMETFWCAAGETEVRTRPDVRGWNRDRIAEMTERLALATMRRHMGVTK